VEILKDSYEQALSMLRENRAVMDKLAEYLIEKETITGKEFMEIFRREKGIPEPEEEKQIPGAEPVITAEVQTNAGTSGQPVSGSAGASGQASADSQASAQENGAGNGNPGEQNTAAENSSPDAGQQPSADGKVSGQQETPQEDNRPVGRFSNGKLDL
jgi:cell division protease FtsH